MVKDNWLLVVIDVVIMVDYMQKAYIEVIQNHFFRNNSCKLELIGMKFYKKMSSQLACFSANFWRLAPTERKMAAKKRIL